MTTKKKVAKPILRNYIVMVLDTSSSMSSIINDAYNMYNNVVESTKQTSKDQKQEVFISSVLFDATVRPSPMVNINSVKPLVNDGRLGHSTALMDATGVGIEILEKHNEPEKGVDKSFLLIVITDGEENSSRDYNSVKLGRILSEINNREDFTVAFQVPRGTSSYLISRFSIPRENIREWETTTVGVQETQVATSYAMGEYMLCRNAGIKKSSTFFVEPDLSGVTLSTLKKVLTDVSNQFKTYNVEKEIDIKSFVEDKTGRPYVAGSVYYELMKKEKVQNNKQVVLMDKSQKKLWGGQEARDLIGLPSGVEAKVEPGNHANYKIFLESRSLNRKLVRGTTILLNKAMAGV